MKVLVTGIIPAGLMNLIKNENEVEANEKGYTCSVYRG
jgi:hypothetical protein